MKIAYPTAMTTISRHMNCLVVRVRGGHGVRWGRGGCGMPGRTYPQSHHTAAELKPCPRDCRPQAHEESALAAVVLIKVSRQLTVGLWRPSRSPTSDLWDCVKVSPAEGANICRSHVHGACMTSVCFFLSLFVLSDDCVFVTGSWCGVDEMLTCERSIKSFRGQG